MSMSLTFDNRISGYLAVRDLTWQFLAVSLSFSLLASPSASSTANGATNCSRLVSSATGIL